MLEDPLVKSLLTNVVEDESNLAIVEALYEGVDTDEEIANKTGIKLVNGSIIDLSGLFNGTGISFINGTAINVTEFVNNLKSIFLFMIINTKMLLKYFFC